MKKVVVCIFVLIVIIIGAIKIDSLLGNIQSDVEDEIIQEEVAEEQSDVEDEEVIEDITINISVVGDIMCHNSNYNDAYNSDTDSYDFSYVFEDVAKYLVNADLTIGNLETTLTGKEAGYSSYPLFNTPEILATNLKSIGFDVLVTANNHCLDKGFVGIENTISELDKANIEHTGTYATEEASNEYLIKDVKGIKIAILDYTYGTNGIAIPSGKEFCVNLIDEDKIKSDLENVRDEVDVVCVVMHWGTEYRLTPTEEQEQLADFLFENGADLILGGHSHCLEPMEKRTITLEDGTTKEGFIVYSLGNFMSGQNKAYTRQSAILNIQITKVRRNRKYIYR